MTAKSLQHSYLAHYSGITLLLIVLFGISLLSAVASDTGFIVLTLILWCLVSSVLFIRARQKRALFLLQHWQDDSPVKPWLVGGPILWLLGAILSFPLTLSLMMVLSQGLSASFWFQLMLFAYLWPLLLVFCQNLLAGHLKPQALAYFALSLSFAIAAVYWFLLYVLAGFITPVPDVTTLSLSESFQYGQSQLVGNSPLLRTLAGVWLGFDGVRLWMAQYLASSGLGAFFNIAIWLVSLLQTALFIVPILILFIGSSLFASSSSLPPFLTNAMNKTRLQWLLIAVLPLLIFCYQTSSDPFSVFLGKKTYLQIEGNVYAVKENEFEQLLNQQIQQLDSERARVFEELNQSVSRTLDQVFNQALTHIPDYADWHYSLLGAGERAYASVVAKQAPEQLLEKLFPHESFEVQMARINHLLLGRFSQAQQQFADQLLDQLVVVLANKKVHPHSLANKKAQVLDVRAMYAEHISEQLAVLEARRQFTHAISGASLATLSFIVARQAVIRGSQQAALQGVVRGGSRLMPAVCVATGPAALACGALVFSLSTVVLESAILYWDEAQNRAQLEEKLAQQLQQMRDDLKMQYRAQILAMLQTDNAALQGKLTEKLRPIDQI